MTPPTVIEEDDERIVVRKRAGKAEDRLEIRIVELLSDVTHEMGEAAGLEKDGVERDLQEALAAAPERLGEELRLVRREWPTDVGPVDLMCRDREDGWVAVEIKRIGTIEAVEQLSRYLECIRVDPAKAACRGILAAQQLKPQAVALATARGISCVEVDLDRPPRAAGARVDAVLLAEGPLKRSKRPGSYDSETWRANQRGRSSSSSPSPTPLQARCSSASSFVPAIRLRTSER